MPAQVKTIPTRRVIKSSSLFRFAPILDSQNAKATLIPVAGMSQMKLIEQENLPSTERAAAR
jgi:hypothetical protein